MPTISPVEVIWVLFSAREMPKSMTRGPSRASITLAGLRSRCTRPLACTACSASTRPAASFHTDATGSGPPSATASASDGPGTNAVASQGGSSSGPAAVTGAVYAPLTDLAAATSRRNLVRNTGSAASSWWMTFTATGRPAGEYPRNTWPIPPAPSRARSRYGPTCRGSLAASGFTVSPTAAGTVPPAAHH